MELGTVREFFMWCTVINAALLATAFVFCACAGGLIYRIHTKWFPMPKETFTVVVYSSLGIYKILFVVFSLVPYVAILIAS